MYILATTFINVHGRFTLILQHLYGYERHLRYCGYIMEMEQQKNRCLYLDSRYFFWVREHNFRLHIRSHVNLTLQSFEIQPQMLRNLEFDISFYVGALIAKVFLKLTLNP